MFFNKDGFQGLGAGGLGLFQGREIHAAPLRQGLLPRAELAGTEGREASGGEGEHGPWSGLRLGLVLVQDEHAVGREVVIAGKGIAGEEIVHRFEELDADG